MFSIKDPQQPQEIEVPPLIEEWRNYLLRKGYVEGYRNAQVDYLKVNKELKQQIEDYDFEATRGAYQKHLKELDRINIMKLQRDNRKLREEIRILIYEKAELEKKYGKIKFFPPPVTETTEIKLSPLNLRSSEKTYQLGDQK